MPYKRTVKKAQKDKRLGKSGSTQASHFVKESIDKIKKGKHGAKNTEQAIAIGLSEARRSGVKVPPKNKTASSENKHTGRIAKYKTSAKRSRSAKERLKKERSNVVSFKALSDRAKKAAAKRTKSERHRSALKAARTREENKKAA